MIAAFLCPSRCECTLLNRMKCTWLATFFFGALAFVLAPTGQAFLFMGPLAGNTTYEEISFAAFQGDISRRSPFQDASLKGCLLPRRPPQLCRRPPLQRQKSLVESQRIQIIYQAMMTMRPGGDPPRGPGGGGSANFARCMDGRTSYRGG